MCAYLAYLLSSCVKELVGAVTTAVSQSPSPPHCPCSHPTTNATPLPLLPPQVSTPPHCPLLLPLYQRQPLRPLPTPPLPQALGVSISERALVQIINTVDSPQALPLAFAALGVMVQGRVAPTEVTAEALRSMCRRVALARDPVPGSLLGTMQHRTLDTSGAHSSL